MFVKFIERVLRIKYGNNDDIKKMPDAAAILLFNSCFNAERLERGQSTENTSVLVSGIMEARKRRSVDKPTCQPIVRDNVIDQDDSK